MPIIEQNWLNAQATRRYPLDDNATGTGDDGSRIKDDVIVDMYLRWPVAAGEYAFVSGITVTDTIVTVVILGCDASFTAASFTPLASVSIAQPVDRHRFYEVEALYPGAGGYIVFGDTDENFAIRFSTPQQGLLAPRIAQPYDALPVTSVAKLGRSDKLTGLVRILPGTDIEITADDLLIGGRTRRALVVQLARDTDDNSLLEQYAGPCGIRPESENCARVGVETINNIPPDCYGNFDIEFQGIVTGNFDYCGSSLAGIVLNQSLGLEDVCTDKTPTRFQGQDSCEASSSLLPIVAPSSSSDGGEAIEPPSVSSSSEICAALPFYDCFDLPPHSSWSLKMGSITFVEADSPGESCSVSASCGNSTSSSSCLKEISKAVRLNDQSRRNVYLWEDCGTGASTGKRVRAHVKLVSAVGQQNAGLVLNYHTVDPITNPHIEYFLLQINRSTNRVELAKFNGTIANLQTFAAVQPFSLNDWFDLDVTCSVFGSDVLIEVSVENASDPAWPSVSFSYITSTWGNADGYYGIHTDRAKADFSFWELQNA